MSAPKQKTYLKTYRLVDTSAPKEKALKSKGNANTMTKK